MMDPVQELEHRIKTAVQMDSPAPSGFHPVYCPICQSQEKKGGFKFESNQIVYHCFKMKCDASCVFTEGEYVSKKFRNLMRAIGVEIPPEILYANNKSKKKVQSDLNTDLYEEFYPKELDSSAEKYPDDLVPYNPKKHKVIKRYIENRCLPEDGEYYISFDDYRWKNRLIVPSYYNNKLIGLVGRDVLNKGDRPKYMTVSDGNLIYFRERRLTDTVFVVEGVLDALMLPNGVACNGDDISKKTAFLLSYAKRVVLIPDRDNDKFLNAAKRYHWEICIPKWDAKDLNGAVQKYGHFVSMRMIRDNIFSDYTKAEIEFKFWSRDA